MRVYAYFLTIIVSSLLLIGCENRESSNVSSEIDSTKNVVVNEERLFYKTIDVVITDIDCTWSDVIYKEWRVKYKSDEYGVEGSDRVSNSDSLGHKIYSGRIGKGDIIQCTLWTNTKGDEVVSRRLGNISK